MNVSIDRIMASGAAHALLRASIFVLIPLAMAVSSCDMTIKVSDGPDDVVVQEPVQKVMITFTGSDFTVPLIYGDDFYEGKIIWGDGSEDEIYEEEASHTYSSEGKYVVTIEAPDADTIEFTDLVGISDLDFSGF